MSAWRRVPLLDGRVTPERTCPTCDPAAAYSEPERVFMCGTCRWPWAWRAVDALHRELADLRDTLLAITDEMPKTGTYGRLRDVAMRLDSLARHGG